MDTLLLRDYRPVNVNNIPVTYVEKAKYPVIDMHSHDYVQSPEEVEAWVKNMDACNIRETHVMDRCSLRGNHRTLQQLSRTLPLLVLLRLHADAARWFR